MVKQANSKLLLVEDSHALARVYQEFLKPMAIDVTHVTEGKVGLDQIKTSEPNVVLLDLNLPDMNGLELLGHLKKLPQDPSVVVITAMGTINTLKAIPGMVLISRSLLSKSIPISICRM